MRDAVAAIAAETGLAPAMVRECLPRQLEPLRAAAVERLLDEEIGNASTAGAALIAHIVPGNVPALAAAPTILSLAIGAAALIKPGRDEQSFAPRFASSLAEVDADLGAAVAVHYWKGGADPVEDAVFAAADVVDYAGGDEALAAIEARVRGRFVGRGARLSFAALGREVAADDAALRRAAAAIAADTAIWEQRGCLSPQIVLVETTSSATLDAVGAALAEALDEIAVVWPRAALSLDEKAAALRFRNAVEWGLGGESGARILNADGGTLLVERAAALRPTCLQRTLRVQPLADFDVLASLVEPERARIEAIGLAVVPEHVDALAACLREIGVPRVCAAGEMQRPDLTWKPGGVPRLARWLEPGEGNR